MRADAAPLDGAFADPPQQAARCFRRVLDAMARPGTVHDVPGVVPPPELSAAAGAVLLVLCDADTRLWLPRRLAGSAVERWLAFHTNLQPVSERSQADFALGRWEDLAGLADWPAGTPDHPDRSATLIVELDALEGGPELRLSGPGVKGTRPFAPTLPAGAALELAASHRRFPLGLDLLLAAGERIAGLPRSTAIGV